MGKIGFVFPGQGAQYVGMGKDFIDHFPTARTIYEEANDQLGIDITKLCLEGPNEELIKTENTQPAILTTSIAILRVLEDHGIDCEYTAGLSLGEYASLIKANVFTFADAVKVVKQRGKYMQEAVPIGKGTMAAILGMEKEVLVQCIEAAMEKGIVEIANYNSPNQIVISGEIEAVQAVVDRTLKYGAKKALLLPVSAPFHCSLLRGAGEKLKLDLEKISINMPQKSVVSNAEAKILKKTEEIIPSLVKQISSSVLWVQSIELMIKHGVDIFVEIGPGKSLSSFIKRISRAMGREITIYNVEDLLSFQKFAKQFN